MILLLFLLYRLRIRFRPRIRVRLFVVALRRRSWINVVVGHEVRRQSSGQILLFLVVPDVLVVVLIVDIAVLEVLIELRLWRRLVIILRMTLLGVEHDDRWRLQCRLLFVLHGLAVVVLQLEPPVVDLVVQPVERAGPEVQRVRRFARFDSRVTEVTERTEYGGRRLCEHFDLVRLFRFHHMRRPIDYWRPVGRVPDGWRYVHDARQVGDAESGRPLVDTGHRYPVIFWISGENL